RRPRCQRRRRPSRPSRLPARGPAPRAGRAGRSSAVTTRGRLGKVRVDQDVERPRTTARSRHVIDVGDTGAGTGSRRRRLWRWAAVAAVALVAAAAFGWFVVLRDPADPISVGEAVDRYREGEDAPATGEV